MCINKIGQKLWIFLTLTEVPISTRVTIQNHAFLALLLIGIAVKGVEPKPCCRESIHMPALPCACHSSHKHIKKLCSNVREMCANCRFVGRAPSHFIDNPLAFGFSPGAVDMVWLQFPPIFAMIFNETPQRLELWKNTLFWKNNWHHNKGVERHCFK